MKNTKKTASRNYKNNKNGNHSTNKNLKIIQITNLAKKIKKTTTKTSNNKWITMMFRNSKIKTKKIRRRKYGNSVLKKHVKDAG
jgi:hypothetical protein